VQELDAPDGKTMPVVGHVPPATTEKPAVTTVRVNVSGVLDWLVRVTVETSPEIVGDTLGSYPVPVKVIVIGAPPVNVTGVAPPPVVALIVKTPEPEGATPRAVGVKVTVTVQAFPFVLLLHVPGEAANGEPDGKLS
jgi:hypothetical protein